MFHPIPTHRLNMSTFWSRRRKVEFPVPGRTVRAATATPVLLLLLFLLCQREAVHPSFKNDSTQTNAANPTLQTITYLSPPSPGADTLLSARSRQNKKWNCRKNLKGNKYWSTTSCLLSLVWMTRGEMEEEEKRQRWKSTKGRRLCCVRVWTVVVEMRQAQDDRRCCSEGDCYGFWATAAAVSSSSSW